MGRTEAQRPADPIRPEQSIRIGPYHRYLLALTVVFAAEWIVLAIHPVDRTDWGMENVLVAFFVIGLALSYRHLIFSRLSYTAIFLYLSLHEIGAHYTYAGVPYDNWFQALTGHSLNQFLSQLMGWHRNNYDRLVHFSYGVLMAYPIREVYLRVVNVRGFWGYFLPLSFIMSTSMAFELLEWGSSVAFGGKIALHYIGAQGDFFDAQKDMAAATLGAFLSICGTALVNAYYQRDFAREWAESLHVKYKIPFEREKVRPSQENRR